MSADVIAIRMATDAIKLLDTPDQLIVLVMVCATDPQAVLAAISRLQAGQQLRDAGTREATS